MSRQPTTTKTYFSPGDFIVVKICGKTKYTFRLKVLHPQGDGYVGFFFLKKAPQACSFLKHKRRHFVSLMTL